MTIIEKHLKEAIKEPLRAALLKEIEKLKANPHFNKDNLSYETFNALDSRNCFFGQGFDQGSGRGSTYAAHHRNLAGRVTHPFYERYVGMTYLEVWSATIWDYIHERKKDVLAVLLYLRGDRDNLEGVDLYL